MDKHRSPHLSNSLHWAPIQIAGLYLLLGGLWILFSDKIASRIALSQEMLTTISLYKGWGYVLVTAFLLYWLIQRYTVRLRASEMQLQRMVDAMPLFISYVDSERRYRFTNNMYKERFDDQAEGKHIEEVLGKAAYRTVSKYIDTVLTGEITSYETEIPYEDTELFMSVTYIPDLAAGGRVKGFFVMAQDRTAQRQAEEEHQLWAHAFEGCAHGIAIGDPNTNRIVVCNPAFATMHKCRVEDIVGTGILSLYAPSDHEHVRNYIKKADQIGHTRHEARMIRRDRSTFPVQMDVVSVLGDDGDLLYRVVTAVDISERKHQEEENKSLARFPAENPNPILRATLEGKLIYANAASELLLSAWDCKLDDYLSPHWINLISELVATGSRKTVDVQCGDIIYSIMIVPVPDANYVNLYGRDITERKQAEDALRQSEERFASAFRSSPTPITLIRLVDSKIMDVNEAFCQLFGYSREEVVGHTSSEIGIPGPESRQKAADELKEKGMIRNLEQTARNRAGARLDTLSSREVIDINGESYALTTIIDITERKKAEENLRRYELLSEHSRDIILFMNRGNGRILEVNAAAIQAYGYHHDEFLTLTIHDLRASDTLALTSDQMTQSDAGGILFETVHKRKDGTTFPVEVSSQGATISGVRTLVSIVRDITERKQAEEALQLKDELLHLTSELAKVGGWEFDPGTGKGTWTDEVARIHDLDPSKEANVEIGLSFYVGESRQKIEQAVKEAIELGKSYDLELEMVSAKGDHKWVRTVALPLMNDGKVVKVQGIFQDITQRKQAEAALQQAHDELELKVEQRTSALSEANNLLQALMDHMPDQIYFKDTQGRFIRNSRSQSMLLGLNDPAETVGKTDFDFFPHAERAYAEEQEVMRSGKPLVDIEEWVVWPDGQETWVSTTKVPLRNSDGETIGIFGISRDITERKRTEQSIRQLNADLENQAAQLLAANKELEAFSYSVSHDLRAPLRAIDGYTRILVEDYETILDSEGKRVCSVISREARRMGQLIDDLLAFSRLGRREMHSSRIDMKAVAVSVFNELMKEENAERIDFQITKLPSVKGDSSLIRQVWANLLSNAIKFTSKRERATIEVGSKPSKDEIVYYVRDSGAGFEMEYSNKLFGVFQRLHSESEFIGTGVGLAIVQRIIHRHGGRVWAEGEVEQGATFYFALPRKENHHD